MHDPTRSNAVLARRCARRRSQPLRIAGEICDNFDDDCDGTVDEDFIDAETGGYTTDAHCGRCNNDCVGRLAGNAVNGQGYCDPTVMSQGAVFVVMTALWMLTVFCRWL